MAGIRLEATYIYRVSYGNYGYGSLFELVHRSLFMEIMVMVPFLYFSRIWYPYEVLHISHPLYVLVVSLCIHFFW